MFAETKEWCGKAIEMDGHNADALCARAEAYIEQELFEEGQQLATYETAKLQNSVVTTLKCSEK